jgi:hypothetical protein
LSLKSKLINKHNFYSLSIGGLFIINELRYNFVYYSTSERVLLIFAIAAFCFISSLLAHLFVKDSIKAFLISALFIVINIFYQDIVKGLLYFEFNNYWISSFIPYHSELFFIPFLTLIWILTTILLVKSKRNFKLFYQYINFLFVLFIVIEIAKWVFIANPQIRLIDNQPITEMSELNQKEKPDIYYIILDSYTSSESLKKYWKYDNTAFEDTLTKEGFYISHKSEANYISTNYCIASYLNSSFLEVDKKATSEHNLYYLIKKNRVVDFLIREGYTIKNFSLFDINDEAKFYDYLTYNHCLGRTIWYVNAMKLKHHLFPSTNISHTNLEILNLISNLYSENNNNPIFVYAHIMMPHTPYSFNENGEELSVGEKKLSDKEKYLKQLIFTNKVVAKTIHTILLKSKKKPVIIIQGDHGFRFLHSGNSNDNSEAHTIFNAYYFPDRDYATLNDSVKPVNTFRVLFNKYFKCNIPMLKDTTINISAGSELLINAD